MKIWWRMEAVEHITQLMGVCFLIGVTGVWRHGDFAQFGGPIATDILQIVTAFIGAPIRLR